MNAQSIMRMVVLLGGVAIAGCPDDGGGGGDETGSTGDPTMTTTSPSTSSPSTTSPSTTSPSTSTTEETTTGPDPSTGPDESSSSGGGDGYAFADDPYDAYTQIDRHAAVEAGTAGIAGPEGLGFAKGSDISIRDDYNASNPAEDAAGMWLSEISDSVTFFHAALDDDIIDAGFTPASVKQALAHAGTLIVPDTIKYDPSQPTAYPNGRTLTDPVVDITLAAVLLQLGKAQPLSSFADLPLNPPANDVPFGDEFPYLAPPH